MMFESLLNRGSLPVLQQVMSFTQARHAVLANNISNLDTVGFKMKDLPAEQFFQTLNEAIERRDKQGASAPLQMKSSRNLQWNSKGNLNAQAVEVDDNNILFHDGNNRFVEKQMSNMAQNALLHTVSVELLRQQYGLLQMAISGKV